MQIFKFYLFFLKNLIAHIRITVDGGTNRWLTFIKTHFQDKEELRPPDIISGDFDSITQETSNYFKEIQRIHTPDQNETDFTKALKILKPLVEEKKVLRNLLC